MDAILALSLTIIHHTKTIICLLQIILVLIATIEQKNLAERKIKGYCVNPLILDQRRSREKYFIKTENLFPSEELRSLSGKLLVATDKHRTAYPKSEKSSQINVLITIKLVTDKNHYLLAFLFIDWSNIIYIVTIYLYTSEES